LAEPLTVYLMREGHIELFFSLAGLVDDQPQGEAGEDGDRLNLSAGRSISWKVLFQGFKLISWKVTSEITMPGCL